MSVAPGSTRSGASAPGPSSLKLTSQASAGPSSAQVPSASSLASQRLSTAVPAASSASAPESVAVPSSAAVSTRSVDSASPVSEPSAASAVSTVVHSSPSASLTLSHAASAFSIPSAAPGISSFSSAASVPSKGTPSSLSLPVSKGRQANLPPAVTSTEVAPSSLSASAPFKASSAPATVATSRSRPADPPAQSSGDLVSTIFAVIPSSMARSPGGPGNSAVASDSPTSAPAPVSGVKADPSEPTSSSAAPKASSQAPQSSSASDTKPSSAAPSPALSSSESTKSSSASAPSSDVAPSSHASSTHDASSQSPSASAPSKSSQAQSPAAPPSSAAPDSSSASSASFSKPTANKANAQSSVTTSTITDHPETTLSEPIVVSTTDSKGHTTVTIPPVVTSLAVSTQANGSLVTFTHIEANPTGVWAIGVSNGFFSHGGAVAGVFVVVGLIVATIAAAITWILCKRRRRRFIRTSISRPLPQPDNPFEDPRATPSPTQMRYVGSDNSHRNLLGTGLGVDRAQRNLLDEEFAGAPAAPPRSHPPSVRSSSGGHEATLAGVGAGGKSMGRAAYDAPMLFSGPNSGYNTFVPGHQHRPSQGSGIIGLALTNDDVQDLPRPTPRHFKRASATPSAAPSTPSIYPATLAGGDEDISTESSSSHVPPTPSTTESPALSTLTKPPRPPRRRPVGPLPPRHTVPTSEQASKLLVHTRLAPTDAQIMDRRLYDSPTPSATTGSDSGGHSPASEYPITPASAFTVPSMYPATPGPEFSPASLYPATPATVYSPPSVYPATPQNPFSDYNSYVAAAPPSPGGKPRENFYTRRKLVNSHLRKPSLEWKH